MTSAEAGAPRRWTGDRVVQALQTQRVSLEHESITGDIDFRRREVVGRVFSCRNCTINGRILADDVVFGSTFDLSGTEVTRGVLIRRATFRGPALFGSSPAERPTVFSRGADFGFATFENLTTFVGAEFLGRADFSSARCRVGCVFADATFEGEAWFDRAVFSGGANFRGSAFSGPARFSAAQFEGRADFSASTFERRASFDEARFSHDATFLGADFTHSGGRTYGVTFGGAVSERDLVFDLAKFNGRGIFRQTVAGGALSFAEAEFTTSKPLVFENVSAAGIAMDVDDVLDVVAPAHQVRVLERVEAHAKANGDLGVANDARFARNVLESRGDPWPRRLVDVLFHRLIAGYFVRPLHPVLALVALVGFLAVVRVARRSPEPSAFVHRQSLRLRAVGREFVDALALIPPGGPAVESGRRLEVLVYRVLVVCALIGLGNSNPTLREMFDALV